MPTSKFEVGRAAPHSPSVNVPLGHQHLLTFTVPSMFIPSATCRPRRESRMQPIGAPASTSRQAVYNPPCVDLWDTVYPTELMVCSMFIQCVSGGWRYGPRLLAG